MSEETSQMRPVIVKTLAVCLAVAVAPWMSGGQQPEAILISGFVLLLGALLAVRQPLMRQLARGPLAVAYWLLIGLAGLSLVWTASRYSTTVWIVQWVMAGLVFRLAYAISGSKLGRRWVAGAYAVSAGLFSLAAIWMYFTSEYGRLTGTFYWANPAAAYLIPAVLIGLDRMRRANGRKTVAWIAYTVLSATAFLLTDSRAATVVLAVVVIIYLALVKLNRRYWITLVFTALAAYGLSTGIVRLSTITAHHTATATLGSRFGEAIKGEAMSGSDRLYYLGSAAQMWTTHPWTGVGAGAYGDVHPGYQQRVVSASTSAHNVYVQVWAELGIFGALLLLALVVVLAWGSVRGLLERPELLPVALGTLGIAMHAGLDIDARYPALLGLVGMFSGLMYVQKSEKWVKPSWIWPAVALAVLVPVVSLYFSATWAGRARDAQTDEDYELAASEFARSGSVIIYNPDVVGAMGINLYSQALLGGPEAKRLADEALAAARQAQALDSHDGQHYELEGRVLLLRRDNVGAEQAFRRALVLDPYNHPEYALDLAYALMLQNRSTEAVAVTNAMLAQYPPAVVANRGSDEMVAPTLARLQAFVGNEYLKQGRLEEARAAAKRAVELAPTGLAGRALKNQVDAAR